MFNDSISANDITLEDLDRRLSLTFSCRCQPHENAGRDRIIKLGKSRIRVILGITQSDAGR